MQIVRSCAVVLVLGLTLVCPDQAGEGDSAANGARGCAITAGRGGCELRRPAQPNGRAPRVARLAQPPAPPAPPAPLQPRLGPMADEYGRAYTNSNRAERMNKRNLPWAATAARRWRSARAGSSWSRRTLLCLAMQWLCRQRR